MGRLQPLQALGRLLEVGIELERLAEVGDGAGGIAEPLADEAARGEGACRMRVKRDCAVDVVERLGIPAGEVMRPGAVVIGERGVR